MPITTTPATTETITNALAVRDDDCAPAMSPAATFPFHLSCKDYGRYPQGQAAEDGYQD